MGHKSIGIDQWIFTNAQVSRFWAWCWIHALRAWALLVLRFFASPFLYNFKEMTEYVVFIRRDSDFDYSDDTIPENIYIYEVFKLYKRSLQYCYTFSQEHYLFRGVRILLCWVECMTSTGCASMTCDGKTSWNFKFPCSVSIWKL